jgi:hypothetical protein
LVQAVRLLLLLAMDRQVIILYFQLLHLLQVARAQVDQVAVLMELQVDQVAVLEVIMVLKLVVLVLQIKVMQVAVDRLVAVVLVAVEQMQLVLHQRKQGHLAVQVVLVYLHPLLDQVLHVQVVAVVHTT